jgi:hypothetical protein
MSSLAISAPAAARSPARANWPAQTIKLTHPAVDPCALRERRPRTTTAKLSRMTGSHSASVTRRFVTRAVCHECARRGRVPEPPRPGRAHPRLDERPPAFPRELSTATQDAHHHPRREHDTPAHDRRNSTGFAFSAFHGIPIASTSMVASIPRLDLQLHSLDSSSG